MTPLGIVVLFIALIVVLSASRENALLGMVAGALYLCQELNVNIGGFNMFAFRFLEIAGFIRVIARKEFSFSSLNRIDRILLLFYAFLTVVFILRATDSYIYQIGIAVDALLTYFTFRGLLGGVDDTIRFFRKFLIVLAPYVAMVLIEFLTRYSPFTLLGAKGAGIAEPGLWDRNGKPRCFGSFRNPSLLGTLGGTFLTFYIALWMGKIQRKHAIAGVLLCFLLVIASNSGGPLNCVAVCLLGWGFWLLRKKMKLVRWGLVLFVLVMGMVMKAPIWYLPARASSISGGDGYHRSYLMDVAFQNIGKWWFDGMDFAETRDWFPYLNAGTGNADITNQYLLYGLTSGLGALALFIAVLTVVFSQLGKAMQRVRSQTNRPGQSEYMLWGLGVLMSIHCINWFGITYFDQTYVFWFMELAMIANLTTEVLQPVTPTIADMSAELPADTAL